MEFRFPEDVEGWLSREEGRLLYELASGKDVLEIGSYCGKSTICLAQSAKTVTCIDPFDGRATPRPHDTYPAFIANLGRYSVAKKVYAYRYTAADAGPLLVADDEGRRYGVVFIDGAHDAQNVRTDFSLARALLAPGGLVAFHDYRDGNAFDGRLDPGVDEVVNGLVAAGAVVVCRAGTIAVLDVGGLDERNGQPEDGGAEKPFRVLVGMPRHKNDCALGAAGGFFHPTRSGGKVKAHGASGIVSSLTGGFNNLWAAVRNEWEAGNLDGFAMIHSDVAPAAGWLDVLYAEMVKAGADLISAVAPIKDDRGLCSTAIDDSGDPWRVRRLTMAQIHDLPVTFADEDAGGPLLLNTGLWLCKLGPWCLEAHFRWQDTIRREEGRWVARQQPEDYDWSRQLRALGLKLCATRAAPVIHWGDKGWSSEEVWGWPVDQEVKKARVPSQGAVAASGG